MTEQLKPCPFCKGVNLNLNCDDRRLMCDTVECNGCGALVPSSEWNTRADGWISVDTSLPELNFESEEDPDVDGCPQFHGMISQSIEITDGEGKGQGHFRSDGKWICYGAEYDMMMFDPEKVTHWAPLSSLPAK